MDDYAYDGGSPLRGRKVQAKAKPIHFRSRTLGIAKSASSPGELALGSPVEPQRLLTDDKLKNFVLHSSTQTIRRSLGLLDLDPKSPRGPGSGRPSTVSDAMRRDREGHLRLDLPMYQQQTGRPISPGRAASSPRTVTYASDGGNLAEDEADPFVLGQPLPNIQASAQVQNGFLLRLRTPAQGTRDGSSSGARDVTSLLEAGDASTSPRGDYRGRADQDNSRSHASSAPQLAAWGPGGWAAGSRLDLVPPTQPSNPVAAALFQGPADLLGSEPSRPATTGGIMGMATLLTPEEDVFHMASNLGIIHARGASSAVPGPRRPKAPCSRSPVRTASAAAVPGLGLGSPAHSPSRSTSIMASRRQSHSGSPMPRPSQPGAHSMQHQEQDSPPTTSGRGVPALVVPTTPGRGGPGSPHRTPHTPGHHGGVPPTPGGAYGSYGGGTPPQTQGVSFRVLQMMAEDVFLRDKAMTTGEVVCDVILPETASTRCRYTDLLTRPEQLGPPFFYICHSWKGNFVDMVSAITQLFQVRIPKQNLEETYFWIDILCANQHEGSQFNDLALQREIVSSCERTLFILDREGSCLMRTPCLWELWVTAVLDRFDKGRVLVVPVHWSWNSLLHNYLLLDAATSVPQTTWGLPSLAKEAQRRAMLADMARGRVAGEDLTSMSTTLKDVLLLSVKRELQRAEKIGNLSPRWLILSANTSALMLHLRRCYSEAEDVLKQAIRAIEKAPPRTIPDADALATKMHYVLNMHERGGSQDAEGILQDMLTRFNHMMSHEVYIECMALMSTIQCVNHSYMRAEMLCHRAMAEIEKTYGTSNPIYTKHLLQLATIAASQRLVKQAEESSHDVLQVCIRRHPPLASALVPIIKAEKQQHQLNPLLLPFKASGKGSMRRRAKAAATERQPTMGSDVTGDDGEEREVVLVPLLPPVGTSGGSGGPHKVEERVQSREHERALLDAVGAMHVLAFCAYNAHRLKLALALVLEVLAVRMSLLHDCHPLTIESQYLQSKILAHMERVEEAKELMKALGKKMNKTWGPDQPESVEALSELADLHHELGEHHEAELVERDIIDVGKALLSHPRTLDRVRNMSVLCTILAARDHLVDKASLLLAKTLLVYREKLGTEHKLTKITRTQLLDIVEREKQLGARALHQAKSGGDREMYKVAEVMYKQALAIGKLVSPNIDQTAVAEGLADAQFGQGKIHDAQKTLRHNGLLRANMKDTLPTSFLRFINNRVAKFIDNAEEEEEEGDEGV